MWVSVSLRILFICSGYCGGSTASAMLLLWKLGVIICGRYVWKRLLTAVHVLPHHENHYRPKSKERNNWNGEIRNHHNPSAQSLLLYTADSKASRNECFPARASVCPHLHSLLTCFSFHKALFSCSLSYSICCPASCSKPFTLLNNFCFPVHT